MNQISIKETAKVEGVGYSGRKISAIFHPAEEDKGLVFIVDNTEIPAKLESAENRWRGVSLTNGGKRVYLVEHLLSAVYALGIDNLVIELSGNVCPTKDNCAKEYFEALSGIREEQTASKRFWKYAKEDETHILSDKKQKPDSLIVKPSEGFVINYFSYYPHKVVGKQKFEFVFNEEQYYEEISKARPPVFIGSHFLKNILFGLEKMGLNGINEINYLLIASTESEEYANSDKFGVKYNGKEFVRHKILDVLGTLALTGRHFVNTEFRFNMTGHRFDLYALKKLFAEDSFKTYPPAQENHLHRSESGLVLNAP